MATNWIELINAELARIGDGAENLEAHAIDDAPQWVAWEDTQELTVLNSPEGVYRALTVVEEGADVDAIWFAIQGNINQDAEADVQWSSERGYYRGVDYIDQED